MDLRKRCEEWVTRLSKWGIKADIFDQTKRTYTTPGMGAYILGRIVSVSFPFLLKVAKRSRRFHVCVCQKLPDTHMELTLLLISMSPHAAYRNPRHAHWYKCPNCNSEFLSTAKCPGDSRRQATKHMLTCIRRPVPPGAISDSPIVRSASSVAAISRSALSYKDRKHTVDARTAILTATQSTEYKSARHHPTNLTDMSNHAVPTPSHTYVSQATQLLKDSRLARRARGNIVACRCCHSCTAPRFVMHVPMSTHV